MIKGRQQPLRQTAVGESSDTARMYCECGRPRRIVILSGDADANLGDRAILQAMVAELRAVCPNATITVVSNSPARLHLDVVAIPSGPRGFLQLCRALADSDLVLCGGGGLFQDDDSLVKMPYWCCRVLLARALSGRVVGYSLGVGPLRSGVGRVAARVAFALMQSVSVRDPLAQAEAQPLSTKPVLVVPDPALLLQAVSREAAWSWLAAHAVPTQGRTLIGVAVRRWFPPRNRLVPHKIRSRIAPSARALSKESQRLAELLGRVLDELIRVHAGHVLLIPSYGAAHEGDVAMSRAVMGSMAEPHVQILDVDEPAIYKGIVSNLQLFLGGRMHPAIFAASVGTPVVGLSYNSKFQGFFGMLGLGTEVMDVVDFVMNERVGDLVSLTSAALQGPPVPRERRDQLVECVRNFNRELLGALQ